MNTPLNVTLLANAGLLLDYNGTHILLDGLFDEENNLFSAPPPMVAEQLLQGQGCFSSIDYLLITHDHADHFSADRVLKYLSIHSPKGIFIPTVILQRYPSIKALIIDKQISCFSLESSAGTMSFRLENDITIRPVPTHHLDKVFQDVDHFCFLISFGVNQVLFTSDVDYTVNSFQSLHSTPLSAVFLNPLFYHARNDTVHCQSRLKTDLYCVYHVPFAADDSYGMRAMLHTDVTQLPEFERVPIILEDPMQQIRITF